MSLTAPARHLLKRLEGSGIRLGLESTRRVLSALGTPQARFPSVLIGGTNGKGSTAALLASMATAAGYRTGLYTSPHLEDVEERIRIDGQVVSGALLSRRLLEIVPVAAAALEHPPTYFEALTATAFVHFAEEEVDLAILEVGMGGRLDATNASLPVLSLVTEIGLEHTTYLGDSVVDIAREKAGIFRRGRPAIAWVERQEAWRAIAEAGRLVGAQVLRGPSSVRLQVVENRGWSGQRVDLRTGSADYRFDLPLLGDHQAKNLALAVLGAEALNCGGWSRLERGPILTGAAACRWPGRLERVELEGGKTFLLDAAHNPDGARALARFLARRRQAVALLFGSLADKAVDRVLPLLAEGCERVILTAPRSERAVAPERMLGLLPAERVSVEQRSEGALDRALELETPLVVVCGSIYLLGEVRTLLRRRFGRPRAAAQVSTCG